MPSSRAPRKGPDTRRIRGASNCRGECSVRPNVRAKLRPILTARRSTAAQPKAEQSTPMGCQLERGVRPHRPSVNA